MSESPSPSLVARVEGLILEFFDVSKGQAREHAEGLVLLAEGWGSPETAPDLDWPKLVKKRLADELMWRSQAEQERFSRQRQQSYDAYEAYIQHGKRV